MATGGGGLRLRGEPAGAQAGARPRVRVIRLLVVVMAGLLVGIGAYSILGVVTQPRRTTPFYDPPVLAGQQTWGACAGGFYARHGDTIVLTSTGHCTSEGTVAYDPDGTTVRGVFGPAARDASCPYPGHRCAASDLNYLVVATNRIPWGHLNVVDLGMAGYRVIPSGTRPLACADIAVGDLVEIDGRDVYRSGAVTEKGEYLHPEDGDYFPCMIAAKIRVDVGDSGGAVLVRGIPAGVTSRSFSGWLGFTPLAEGMAIRAFDRLCAVERDRSLDATELTPRQRHRRRLLETRAHADEWLVPPELADTVMTLIAAADRITDPPLALVWTDHLPTAVLACLERRSLARRLADGDPFLVGV